MLEHLFGSKTRVKMLRAFFHEPARAFFVRELSRQLDVQINGVRRELVALQGIEIVKEVDPPANIDKSKVGSNLRKYYMLNADSVLYSELQTLLSKVKLAEEQEFIQKIKEKGGDVKLLLLTGHFTQDTDAPSDMLVVGDLKEKTIGKLIAGYEKEFGIDVRYTLMTEKEFADRQHMMDKFLYALFDSKHVLIVDTLLEKN